MNPRILLSKTETHVFHKKQRVGIDNVATRDYAKKLRTDLNQKYFIRMSKLIDKELLNVIINEAKKADYFKKVYSVVNIGEDRMSDNAISYLLNMVFNCEDFLKFIRKLTGNNKILGFLGRVYRKTNKARHTDAWHDDFVEGRVLALSLNISPRFYKGGDLYIRNNKTNKKPKRVSNHRQGQIIFFKLSEQLNHKLSTVTSGEKYAFAGWFSTQTRFKYF